MELDKIGNTSTSICFYTAFLNVRTLCAILQTLRENRHHMLVTLKLFFMKSAFSTFIDFSSFS